MKGESRGSIEEGIRSIKEVRDILYQLKTALLDPIPGTPAPQGKTPATSTGVVAQKPMTGGAKEMRKTPQMAFKGNPVGKPGVALSPAQPSALNQLLSTLATIAQGSQALADPSVQQALAAIPNIDANVTSLLTAYNTVNPSTAAVANNNTTANNATEYAQEGGRRRSTKRKQNKKRGTRARRR
jgi:hypothetical protein